MYVKDTSIEQLGRSKKVPRGVPRSKRFGWLVKSRRWARVLASIRCL